MIDETKIQNSITVDKRMENEFRMHNNLVQTIQSLEYRTSIHSKGMKVGTT